MKLKDKKDTSTVKSTMTDLYALKDDYVYALKEIESLLINHKVFENFPMIYSEPKPNENSIVNLEIDELT